MVDFSKGIYVGEFKYVDSDGVDQVLVIKPLKGRHYKKLWKLLGKFSSQDVKKDATEDEKTKAFFDSMDEESVGSLHSVCLSSLIDSYPSAKEEDLDLFVSAHLFDLFSVIIDVNMNKSSK